MHLSGTTRLLYITIAAAVQHSSFLLVLDLGSILAIKFCNKIGHARPLYSGLARPFRPSHTAPRGGFAKQTESAAPRCGEQRRVRPNARSGHEYTKCILNRIHEVYPVLGLRTPSAEFTIPYSTF